MIGSLRGLVIVAALAVVLGAVLAVDLARTPAPVDRALLPGLDPDTVTELAWTRGTETLDVVSTRAEKGPGAVFWKFTTPPAVEADAAAVGTVLAALRGARWHRIGEPTPVHTTLIVRGGGGGYTIGIGEPLAGTEQVWLVEGGRGLLVDGWVARALDRDRLSLSITAPFADVAVAGSLIFKSRDPVFEVALVGQPRRVIEPKVQVRAELAAEVEHVVAGITLVRVDHLRARGLTVIAGSAWADIGGPCPGAPELVAFAGNTAEGCIEKPVALEAVIAKLREPPAQIVERRAVVGEPAEISLAHARVDLSPPRINGDPADPARIAELVAALAAPNEPVALPAEKPFDSIIVEDRAKAVTVIDRYPSRVLARRGEAIALKPAPGAWSMLVRPPRELRDLALWAEDPSTIAAIAIDKTTFRAGSVLGEWTGAVEPKSVQALADALAAPRAIGFVDTELPDVHDVIVTIAQPGGKTVTHRFELAAPTAAGCPVRIGIDRLLLPMTVCTLVARAH